MSDEVREVDLAIVTILPEEYQAVCGRLSNPRPASSSKSNPNIYAWELGEIPTKSGGSYTVVVAMAGIAGNNSGALATIATISKWQPRYVFLVGIAGGFDSSGLRKGDVVIADVIDGYEYGKLEKKFSPRNDWTFPADLGLLNGAIAFSLRGSEWVKSIGVEPPASTTPKVLRGQIASGDKVVDDPTNEFFAEVLKAWPRVQAVEMEGAGASAAIEQARSSGKSVGFLMIRGISDLPRTNEGTEVRGTQERDAWKIYAANAAASFTIAYIANGLPTPPNQASSAEILTLPSTERLALFGLQDESSASFGKSEFVGNLGFASSPIEPLTPASHYVLFGAFPLEKINQLATEVIRVARTMLQSENWYNTKGPADLAPKYWPPTIFKIPGPIRTTNNAVISEDILPRYSTTLALSKLVILNSADVFFASAIRFVSVLKNRIAIFEIGPILAQCWRFSGLVAQLQSEISYSGKTYLCIGMVGTLNSHLGGFADGWLSPWDGSYWSDARFTDWSCHTQNLRFGEVVDLMAMKPKEQPEFINRFAEAMSQAYNHEVPRCFEKNTGLLPRHYLERD